MKIAIVITLITLFYSLVWFPFILPGIEPIGSGGFALTIISLFFGIALLVAITIHLGIMIYLCIRNHQPILVILGLELLSVLLCVYTIHAKWNI